MAASDARPNNMELSARPTERKRGFGEVRECPCIFKLSIALGTLRFKTTVWPTDWNTAGAGSPVMTG